MADIKSQLTEIGNLIQGLQTKEPKLYRILTMMNKLLDEIRIKVNATP